MVGQARADSDSELASFQDRKDELSVLDGCVLWGCRVVIPSRGRVKVLEVLHEGHPGITKMKGLARSVVWWPGLDEDLKKRVKSCATCQQHQKSTTGDIETKVARFLFLQFNRFGTTQSS